MRKEKPKGNRNKLNRVVIFPVALFMLIALALGVNAGIDCNLTVPATVRVGSELNVSYNVSGSVTNNVSISIYLKASDTANSTYVVVFNGTNTTNLRHANWTVPRYEKLRFEDSSSVSAKADCILNASASTGGTHSGTSSESTLIVFDLEQAPSIPTNLAPSGRVTNGSDFTFTSSVNGANTTGCTLRFVGKNPGYSTYSATHSGNLCSVAFTNLPRGIFEYTFEATDGLNTSEPTAITQLEIDKRTSTAKKAYIASGGTLPTQASAMAQQKAKGQNAEDVLDRVIAKAPENAQAGLTKAKESVTKQYNGFEAVKTWSGTAVGCGAGMLGLTLGPVGLITIPAGCIGGHILGAVI